MNGGPIPRQDHISRYASAMKCTEEGEVTGVAFMLRKDRNEKYLSVNWLEFFNLCDRNAEIDAVRKALRIKPGANAKIAVMNVGKTVEYIKANSPDSRLLSVVHQPNKDNPSHCGIFGLVFDDHLIADLIAETVQETHPARKINK